MNLRTLRLGLADSAVLGTLVGLVGGSASGPSSGAVPATAPSPRRDDGEIVHLLIRVTLGPRPGDVARVRSISAPAFLEQQSHPDTLDDSAVEHALAELPSLQLPIPACS